MLFLRNLSNTFNCIFLRYFNLIDMQYDLEFQLCQSQQQSTYIYLKYILNICSCDIRSDF